MKPIYLAFIFLLLSVSCWANQIDELKTDMDVERFVISLDPVFTRRKVVEFQVLPTDSIWLKSKLAASNKVKNWEKTDLNKDGHTDLLVVAKWYGIGTYVIIDNGDNTFKLTRFQTISFGDSEVAKIISSKKRPLLLFYTVRRFPDPKKSYLYGGGIDSAVTDTLVYKFDHFINVENKSGRKKVRAISCEIIPTWSEKFKVSIDENGIAEYFDSYRITKEGALRAKVDPAKLKKLYDLIAYIDIKKIKDRYYIDASDLTTARLSINFTDGSSKTVEDYGMGDRWDLQAIYAMFREIFLSLPEAKLLR